MKIGVISFHSCPYSLLGGEGTGGMSVYIRELSSALTDIPGVKIDVFTRVQIPALRGVKSVFPRVRVSILTEGLSSRLTAGTFIGISPSLLTI